MKKTKQKKAEVRTPAPPLHEDQIKADDIRARMTKALEAVCLVIDEGTMCGFVSGFNLGATPDGKRTSVTSVNINRKL